MDEQRLSIAYQRFIFSLARLKHIIEKLKTNGVETKILDSLYTNSLKNKRTFEELIRLLKRNEHHRSIFDDIKLCCIEMESFNQSVLSHYNSLMRLTKEEISSCAPIGS